MVSATPSLRGPVSLSWRQQRWPRTAWARWGFRLLFAVPYVCLADFANAAVGPSAVDRSLHRRAFGLDFTSVNLGWVAHAFPPLPLAIARVFPGGARGLAIAGALVAGMLVQVTVERFLLRRVPTAVVVPLTVAVVATPAFCYLATQDVGSFVGLALLALALTGLLEFTFNRSTQSGFIAGIGFGLAALCSLASIPFVIAGVISVLFVVPQVRPGRDVARRRAAATVLLFPSAAALGGWAFLQWRFTGTWTKSFTLAEPLLLRFPGGVWSSLVSALAALGHDIAFAPILPATAVLLLGRRPRSALVAVVFLACLLLGLWLGTGLSTPMIVVLLSMVGLVLIPEDLSRSERSLLVAVAILQITVSVLGLQDNLPVVWNWTHQVL